MNSKLDLPIQGDNMTEEQRIQYEVEVDRMIDDYYKLTEGFGRDDEDSDENLPQNNKFNPGQPRDGDGKWSDGGGGGSAKPFTGTKSQSAMKYIEDNYGDVEYTEDEAIAINNYTGSMFARMNRTLRGDSATNPINETPERAELTNYYIGVVDGAMGKTKLKTDQTLWRAATSSTELKVGQTFPDKGYGSTSLREQAASVFLGQAMESSKKPVKYIMKINAKKGQEGIFAQNTGNNSPENEFILPHGVNYKVTKVKKNGEFYEVEADLL